MNEPAPWSNAPHLHPKVTNINERNALGLVSRAYVMMEMALKQAVDLEKVHLPWKKAHFSPQRAESMRNVHESMNEAIVEYDTAVRNENSTEATNTVDRVRVEAMRAAPKKAEVHLKRLMGEIEKVSELHRQNSGANVNRLGRDHDDVFGALRDILSAAEFNLQTAEDLLQQQDRIRSPKDVEAGRGR